MHFLYPLRLEASLHETIWGGHRLQRDGWKALPDTEKIVGEAWETEISTPVQNGVYAGQTLGAMVEELGTALLGEQAVALFGQRFPLLAKFIDAHAQLSVQVHPDDTYAASHENGKLGKTEFWYILAAEPGSTIVHGFQRATTREEVHQAIEKVTLQNLLHEETVEAGDVIFVPAGTVHAIGSGILLYELQEYSDVTYRMYDYGRLGTDGKPRTLHIERSLDVSHYVRSSQIKMRPVFLHESKNYKERCLIGCPYFVTSELHLAPSAVVTDRTVNSCVILSSLGAEIEVHYGTHFTHKESLSRGQTMVLPAALGDYRIEGSGILLRSYVPSASDQALKLWQKSNPESVY